MYKVVQLGFKAPLGNATDVWKRCVTTDTLEAERIQRKNLPFVSKGMKKVSVKPGN